MKLMFKLKIDYDWISESASIKVLYAFKNYHNLGDRLQYVLCDKTYILVPEYSEDGCMIINGKFEYSPIHRNIIPIIDKENIYKTKYKSFILEIDTDLKYKITGLPVLLDYRDNIPNLEKINEDIESSPLAFTDIKLVDSNILERKLYKFVYNDRTTEIPPLVYGYYYSEYRDSPKTNSRIKSSPNDYKISSFKFNQIYDRGVHVKNILIDILEYKQKIKFNDWYSEIKYDPFTNTTKEYLYIISNGKYFDLETNSFINKLDFIDKYSNSESIKSKKKLDMDFDNIDMMKSIDWSQVL